MEVSASRNESGIAPGNIECRIRASELAVCAFIPPCVPPCLKLPVCFPFTELYFLIAKFLAAGPCAEAAAVSDQGPRCRMNRVVTHGRVLTHFVSGAEAGIRAYQGKPIGGPDTVHN